MQVLTVGTFDLIHSGHINLFNNCSKLAGKDGEVIVGVNTDEFVLQYKKINPIIPFLDRIRVISSIKNVNKTLANNSSSLKPMLELIMPDILVVGSDWAKKDYYSQIGVDQTWLDHNSILLVYVPYTEGISTTKLKEQIKK